MSRPAGSTQVSVDGLRHLPANDPPIHIHSLGRQGQLLSRAGWKEAEARYPHLDFGGTRELTPNPSIRQKIVERGAPLAVWNASVDAPVLAFFTTDGCKPCELALPTVERLARHWQDKLTTVRIHAPLHPDLVDELDVRSAPTMVLFLGKNRTVMLPGVPPDYDQLRAQLSPYLGFAS